MRPDESVEVAFDITNTGKYKGDEVVQLYIHDHISSITVYELMLRGFERVSLEPGETKRVKMTLEPRHFMMLNRDMKWVIEPGLFDIYIAASSTDVRLAETITQIDPANPDASYQLDSSPLASRLPVTLNKGDEFNITLDPAKSFYKIGIDWRLDTRCSFELLLNLGGGQYTVVKSFESKGGSEQFRLGHTYKAADLMIRVKEGRGVITAIDCQAI